MTEKCTGCNRIVDPEIFNPRYEIDFTDYERMFRDTHCYGLYYECSRCKNRFCSRCMEDTDICCIRCKLYCIDCGDPISNMENAKECIYHPSEYDAYVCEVCSLSPTVYGCLVCNGFSCSECMTQDIRCLCKENT